MKEVGLDTSTMEARLARAERLCAVQQDSIASLRAKNETLESAHSALLKEHQHLIEVQRFGMHKMARDFEALLEEKRLLSAKLQALQEEMCRAGLTNGGAMMSQVQMLSNGRSKGGQTEMFQTILQEPRVAISLGQHCGRVLACNLSACSVKLFSCMRQVTEHLRLTRSSELRAVRADRAEKGFRDVMQVPRLSMTLASMVGITQACFFTVTSFAHGQGMRMAIPVLAAKVSPALYIVGGLASGKVSSTVERLRVRGAQWEESPPMIQPRLMCAASTAGGMIYVLGGHGMTKAKWHALSISTGAPPRDLTLQSVERFDTAASRWERVRPMCAGRCQCAAVTVSGVVYAVGGHESFTGPGLDKVERYDPSLGYWEPMPRMLSTVGVCAATQLNGKLYVIGKTDFRGPHAVQRVEGGNIRSRENVATFESFDALAHRWERLPEVHLPAMSILGHVSAATIGGKIYVTNRYCGVQVKRWDPQVGSWDAVPQMQVSNTMHCPVTAACAGILYVFGGPSEGEEDMAEVLDQKTPVTEGQALDTVSNQWRKLPMLPTSRLFCASASAWS